MHDIKAIRDDKAAFVAGLKRRPAYAQSAGTVADDLLAQDKALRELLTDLQTKQARRNDASKAIGKAKAQKNEDEAQRLLAEVAGLKDDIQAGEARERELNAALRDALAGLPNLPETDVPDGADEADNVPVDARAFGTRPTMNNAKEHFDLGEALGLMDFERAAKVSGSRFVYLKGQMARLERALGNFMIDVHTRDYGYTEMAPPLLVRDDAAFGTGQLPKFSDDLFSTGRLITEEELNFEAAQVIYEKYKIKGGQVELTNFIRSDDGTIADVKNALNEVDEIASRRFYRRTKLWLIPTAEVSLTNYVREEILDEGELPLRFTALTPCFRAEAGAAGRDTRGMIRMHQFTKVELVSITAPEQSNAEHERMTDCAQEILKRLDLHHRVVTLCAGDMGFTAKKTYDIEVWLPGQGAFREISSCSNCGDFQARRMNTRARAKDAKATRFVHTLNGSALAVGRALVAILENYQQADGSIAIPDVLKPYMGGVEKIEAVT